MDGAQRAGLGDRQPIADQLDDGVAQLSKRLGAVGVPAIREAGLEPLADAEAEPDRTRARTVLLLRVIDVAVARRRWIGTLTNDPVVVRLLSEHPPFTAFVGRLYGVLLGGRDDTEDRVAAAVVSAAIAGSVVNPVVSDVDDDTLRTVLGRIIRRVLDLPG